ncbi:MAG: YHS domain-containing protein [Luteitalea sp.]|nr:YHS domain-containing protein [Luteitalea sp.]
MVRLVLYAVLLILFVRAALRLWHGLAEGVSGSPRGDASTPAVQMARDPVCGTFVVPERSLTLSVGGQQLHFCSAACRETYRARRS